MISGVSSQSFNDVFSATYTNYKVLINVDSTTSNTLIRFRFRTASDDSGNNYGFQVAKVDGTAFTGGRVLGTNAIELIYDTGTGVTNYDLTIYNPNRATTSQITGMAYRYLTANILSAENTSATQFTGFTAYPAAGNMTGSISVFGVNK